MKIGIKKCPIILVPIFIENVHKLSQSTSQPNTGPVDHQPNQPASSWRVYPALDQARGDQEHL